MKNQGLTLQSVKSVNSSAPHRQKLRFEPRQAGFVRGGTSLHRTYPTNGQGSSSSNNRAGLRQVNFISSYFRMILLTHVRRHDRDIYRCIGTRLSSESVQREYRNTAAWSCSSGRQNGRIIGEGRRGRRVEGKNSFGCLAVQQQ